MLQFIDWRSGRGNIVNARLSLKLRSTKTEYSFVVLSYEFLKNTYASLLSINSVFEWYTRKRNKQIKRFINSKTIRKHVGLLRRKFLILVLKTDIRSSRDFCIETMHRNEEDDGFNRAANRHENWEKITIIRIFVNNQKPFYFLQKIYHTKSSFIGMAIMNRKRSLID